MKKKNRTIFKDKKGIVGYGFIELSPIQLILYGLLLLTLGFVIGIILK